jgi:hypothetical protein
MSEILTQQLEEIVNVLLGIGGLVIVTLLYNLVSEWLKGKIDHDSYVKALQTVRELVQSAEQARKTQGWSANVAKKWVVQELLKRLDFDWLTEQEASTLVDSAVYDMNAERSTTQ